MGDGYGSQIRGGKYISRDGVSYWGNSFKGWDNDLSAHT